jgi:hypothetical protein
MSFIEDYDVIVNQNEIFYKRLDNKKAMFYRISDRDLDEGVMLNFPSKNMYFSYKADTHVIPYEKRFERAGIIPYTKIDNKKYFCLGVDAKYGTLTDFGGGVKRIENFVLAACRELEEESLGIFNFTTPELMEKVRKNSVTVYDLNTAILFLEVKVDNLDDILTLYQYRAKTTSERVENSDIVWVPEDVFFFLIKSGKSIRSGKKLYPSVYKVVNNLLRSVSNINEIL